jgi:signal transduction histidine kinase
MIIGPSLVIIWSNIFIYFGLSVPFYSVIAGICLIGSISLWFKKCEPHAEYIYLFVASAAIIHQFWLLEINQFHYYILISYILAIFIATLPFYHLRSIIVFLLAPFIFALYSIITNPGERSLLFLLITVSSAWVIHFIFSQKDQALAEQKKAEKVAEAERIKAMSAVKMAALGEMAAGIAHEINNPLAIISGNAQLAKALLSRDNIPLTQIEDRMNTIESTGQRIARIVRGLRYFAKEGIKEESHQATVDSIVEDTLLMCKTRITAKGISLTYDKPSEPLLIDCRPSEIIHTLLNLLNNCQDALILTQKPSIEIKVKAQDGFVRISVIDNGPGVPENLREKILEPFFTTKEVGATGMGLSISKGIVEAHNGSLELDSRPGRTEFAILLPLAR